MVKDRQVKRLVSNHRLCRWLLTGKGRLFIDVEKCHKFCGKTSHGCTNQERHQAEPAQDRDDRGGSDGARPWSR
jgi:hypothetical protein